MGSGVMCKGSPYIHYLYILALFVSIYSTSSYQSRVQFQSMLYFLVIVEVTHNTLLL